MKRREDILQAARKVFAKDGYNGATISRIAEEASLNSPSLVYWYFKNKQELFQAILQDMSQVLNQLASLWEIIDSPPEEVLPLIGNSILETIETPESAEFFSIVVSEVPQNQDLANTMGEKMVLGINFLVAYLDRQIELGRIRQHDVQSSARSFMGSFLSYLLTRKFFLPLRANLPDKNVYLRNIVEIFIKGLQSS